MTRWFRRQRMKGRPISGTGSHSVPFWATGPLPVFPQSVELIVFALCHQNHLGLTKWSTIRHFVTFWRSVMAQVQEDVGSSGTFWWTKPSHYAYLRRRLSVSNVRRPRTWWRFSILQNRYGSDHQLLPKPVRTAAFDTFRLELCVN